MTKAHLQTRLNYGYSYLIFVAGTAGGARGKKICHVEKFQISAHDRCGEIGNLLNYVYNLWHFVEFYTVSLHFL